MTDETTVQSEQEEVIEEQVTDQSTEQTEIDELRAQVAEFEALKAQIAEQEATQKAEIFAQKVEQSGVKDFDKLQPFLDATKLEGDALDELLGILQGMKPKPTPIGTATNGGNGDKTNHQIVLEQAEAKAKRTGSVEDIATFSGLKQKIKQFGGRR
ncbi:MULTISPECIES: hypothetical protein [unclassified Lysinibacillus]|uniref:hypothetical protein n=1 Tax=unclassified Lysinibacillus TaxID=2636778 RepID=UPI000880EDAE|nr:MULTISPECIES: hypothetical protein [unclassified Lysinibacillus]SCY93336.1 hypothetical protein SAMN02787078_03119 [Lysinibacillus sp. SG9]SDB44130.1 hypothetical protein SAMN02787079_03347 [Lysinibacillus sp. TC-37]SFT07620.1 hypothetical protein SAMN02787087_03413 [Lysinibacillus sp. SG55]